MATNRASFRTFDPRQTRRAFVHVFVIALVSILVVVPEQALAKVKGPTAQQIEAFRHMREAHLANVEAEKNLVTQIDKVAAEVKKTIAGQARKPMLSILPVDDQASKKLCGELAAVAGQNPYLAVPRHTFKMAMAGAKEVVASRVKMQLSTNLLSQQITDLRYNSNSGIADSDPNWKAEPGTITILHNGYDLAAVWGADIDGRPVKDAKANRAKIVKIRVAR